jgi:TIR domain-containing protein
MTRVFLSYNKTDSRVALLVAAELRAAGAEVFYYEDGPSRGQQFVQLLENEVNRADLFIAMMSPGYLNSYWCRQERDLAMTRESELRRQFIYVFHVVETPHVDAGFLRTVDWIELRAPVDQAKLRHAVARLALDQPRPAPVAQLAGKLQPRFHNRRDEIASVVNALTTEGGPDLWLVLAPPQMGKSWLLQRVAFELRQKDTECVSRLVDLRAFPELRSDWVQLLCTLLNVEPPGSAATLTEDDERRIAAQVSRRSCLQLCMLDSAERMAPDCVEEFRRALSSIYRQVRRTGNPKTRLSVVVASRQQRGWKGYGFKAPPPEMFEPLPLTEFGIFIVRQVVGELGRQFSRVELDSWAKSLHALSEGLPALLVEGLRWAQDNEFLVQCTDETAFGAVARPYIAQGLLATESLLPLDDSYPAPRKAVLEHALRAIAPYRLFTQSHLKYHLADDRDFDRALAAAEWSLDQLWEALGRTALLKQPSEEIWHVLNPPIRRLLYRYYYPDLTVRVRAHMTARRFYDGWANRFDGTEQVVVLVECLWHEAATILYERPDELPTLLPSRAAELARTFVRPLSYTPTELRDFVHDRMQEDTEFATLMSPNERLFENVMVSIAETISGGT